MSSGQWALLGVSLLSIGLLLIYGRRPERIAATAFLVDMFGAPLVQGLTAFGVRWGAAVLSASLLAILVGLSLRVHRWWLLAASGVQLITLMTYVLPLTYPDRQVWATVSLRYVLWLELMILAAIGLCEARRAPWAAGRANT